MSEHIYEDSDMEHERYHIIPFGSMHEEIVRCRDCANYTYTQKGSCRCDYWMTLVEPDGFCAWGERREP